MGSINIVKTIKTVHQSCMVLVKIGTFYHAYSKDAYILSFLFKYKITKRENKPEVAFPENSLSRVEAVLENNKINYLVVDKRNNYQVEYQNISKQDNNYEKMFEKAKETISYIIRIQDIYENLINSEKDKALDEKLKRIEEVLKINERRKV